jgi:serine/threonine protein kinase
VAELQRKLPQYEIVELLGRGGMGAVFKGWQKSLERPVAIKILPPSFREEEFLHSARFKHEARILARLSHPGIVARLSGCALRPGSMSDLRDTVGACAI